MIWRPLMTVLTVCALGLGTETRASADVLTAWNEQVVTSGGPHSDRTFAMVHIAMFDAVNAIEHGYAPYLNLPPAPYGASAVAAAASAAHGVLVRLVPAQQAALDALLASSLAEVPDGPAEAAGVAFGDVVAQMLYDARLSDRILDPGPAFVDGTGPGEYRLTTPGPPQPVNTGASSWIPFAMTSASQFRPGPPPRLGSLVYAFDLILTGQLGGSTSAFRTADQEEIARWHTEMAHFQFNRIARAALAHDTRSLLERARFLALLNMALCDGTTAVFDAKYTYRFWRPSTAIQNADVVGNPLTSADPGWTPFLTTPPHPEYPAAHGAVQGAGGRVMNWYFGRHYAFETTAPAVPGVTRAYRSFDHFTLEGASARVFGGMHFWNSLDVGARQGRQVAEWVLDRYLKPVGHK
ncbi:MAG: vanadium-dependent haloperoxidase [Vicinamibacterales bacterium]